VENTFGERLRDARLQKGLKQKEVADKLDCAATSLTNWEKGAINPPLEVLARLCEALELDALDLLEKKYKYDDILRIAKTPVNRRSYEQQVALNFSGPILAKTQDKELKRLDKERENKDYVSEATGLAPAAVEALTVDALGLFDEQDESKISPAGLEALNRLLSCEDGLKALANIAVYLRAGDFRFTGGVKAVRVEAGTFSAPGKTVDHAFYLTPDMAKAVAKDEFLRLLDRIKTRVPQDEIDAAKAELRAHTKE
jgi:transcriptional regulator with XRE-family HTH domain